MKTVYFLTILSLLMLTKSAQGNEAFYNSKNINNNIKFNDSLLNKLNVFLKERKYNELIKNAEILESDLLKHQQIDSFLISKIRHKKGYAYYQLNKYLSAINSFNNAIKILPKAKKRSNHHGKILFDRSYAEYYFNQRTNYYKSLKESAAILGEQENPNYDFLLEVYAELSYETKYLSYFKEAESYLKKGYAIIKANKNKTSKDVLFHYYSISLYCSWEKEKEALKHLNDLESLKQKKTFTAAETLMYAVSLNLMADFYIANIELFNKEEALKKAEYYLNRAFKNLDKERNKDNYIQFKFNQNKLFLEKQQFDKVLKNVDELMLITKKTDTRRAFLNAMKAKVFFKTKSKQKAENALLNMLLSIHSDSKSLNSNFSNFNPSTTLHHAWLIYELADEFLEAFPADKQAKKLANNMYRLGLQQFKNCYWQSTFNKVNKDGYASLMFGLLSTKKANKNTAFNIKMINDIENIENRLAWKAFVNNRTNTNIAIPDSLRRKELDLRKKMVEAIKKNDNESYLSEKEQLKELLQFLNTHFPKVASFVYNDFDVKNFQKQLKQDQIVLRYKKFKDHFFLFKITQEDIEILQLPKSISINKEVETYLNNLSLAKEYRSLGKALTQTLIPINIDAYKSFIVIPDGILHHLPFETLLDNSDEFLLENHNISYASHLVFVNSIETLNNENKNGLFVFSPTYNSDSETVLEGATNEAKRINKIFKGELFIGDKALKSHFINKASNAELLHLAMHANLNDENPELSYFSFTENGEDNKIHLEELYALNLNAELAVLSACNTGKSNLENPEGAISLQRAFVFAGVPATVSSLWQVPDKETSTIMMSFYENLNQGQFKDEALRNAKLQYLNSVEDEALKHPFYWAGFVISGDVSAIEIESNNTALIIISILILLALIFSRKKLIKLFK